MKNGECIGATPVSAALWRPPRSSGGGALNEIIVSSALRGNDSDKLPGAGRYIGLALSKAKRAHAAGLCLLQWETRHHHLRALVVLACRCADFRETFVVGEKSKQRNLRIVVVVDLSNTGLYTSPYARRCRHLRHAGRRIV